MCSLEFAIYLDDVLPFKCASGWLRHGLWRFIIHISQRHAFAPFTTIFISYPIVIVFRFPISSFPHSLFFSLGLSDPSCTRQWMFHPMILSKHRLKNTDDTYTLNQLPPRCLISYAHVFFKLINTISYFHLLIN